MILTERTTYTYDKTDPLGKLVLPDGTTPEAYLARRREPCWRSLKLSWKDKKAKGSHRP